MSTLTLERPLTRPGRSVAEPVVLPGASIVIPAHNEATVIGGLLQDLAALPVPVEVIVVCNGCTDDTADVALSHGRSLNLTVASIDTASKVAALNEGDRLAAAFPRFYVDADVRVSPSAVLTAIAALQSGERLAVRPPLKYDTSDTDPVVRAFYRARRQVPYLMNSLWGAGFYAVSESGRARWAEFPADEADDYFVATRFINGEFTVLDTQPVVVSTPKTAGALVRTLSRVYALPLQTEGDDGGSPSTTLRDLLRTGFRSPRNAIDAAAYVGVAFLARAQYRRGSGSVWARDDTRR